MLDSPCDPAWLLLFAQCQEQESIENMSKKANKLVDNISPGPPTKQDRFGFVLVDDFHQALAIQKEVEEERMQKEAERTIKWLKMLKYWKRTVSYRQAKLKRRVRKGIPNSVRSEAWYKISAASLLRDKYPDLSTLPISSIDARTKDEVRHMITYHSPVNLIYCCQKYIFP